MKYSTQNRIAGAFSVIVGFFPRYRGDIASTYSFMLQRMHDEQLSADEVLRLNFAENLQGQLLYFFWMLLNLVAVVVCAKTDFLSGWALGCLAFIPFLTAAGVTYASHRISPGAL